MNYDNDKAFQVKNLDDYIVVLKNLVPYTLCEDIIEEYENSEDFCDAVTTGGINKKVRNCFNLDISSQSIISKNYEKRKFLDNKLFVVAGQALNQYNKLFSYSNNLAGDSGYTLLKYDVGNHYSYHVDDSNKTPRKLSLSLTLNDSFNGGEFSFFHGHKIYKLNKGDGIIFPSSFMYPHAVLPVTEGTRYSIVTWFI
jgi:predicted 2-oxoglutarate/Fe(II)-dependent dioxygenase YbiX